MAEGGGGGSGSGQIFNDDERKLGDVSMMRSVPFLGRELLRHGFPSIEPDTFYREIFGDGELDTYCEPDELAAITAGSAPHTGSYIGILSYVCYDPDGHVFISRRSLLDDLDEISTAWHRDHSSYQLAITSPISYVGFSRKSSNARYLYALAIEIDDLIIHDGHCSGLDALINQWEKGLIPQPTYCVASGSGLHLYYRLEKPIPLYKNVVKSLATYKKHLTRLLWNRYITNSHDEEKIQYESLFQGFRVVGTRTKRGNGEVATAYLTGEAVSIDYLNRFARYAEDQIVAIYKSDLPLAKAKALYPEWYDRRVVKKQPKGHWVCNRAVYDWWLRRISLEAMVGHRYYCLMCLAIYAIKCDIDYEELKRDCFSLMAQYDTISPADNRFTEEDVLSALQAFQDREMVTYPINSISNRSGLHIEKNKRNGRKQCVHLAGARAIQEVNDRYNGTNWREGNGRKSKQQEVQEWRSAHPNGRRSDCQRDLGLSKPTVLKWWDA